MEINETPKRDFLLPASILVSGVLISASLIYVVGAKNRAATPGTAAVGGMGGEREAVVVTEPALTDRDINPNAPITLIEYSDFQCPFCGRFFTQTLSAMKDKYIKTGKVNFVYKDFPLDAIHDQATPAALAARCAKEQGKFWEMHDTIFTNQELLSETNYKKWAVALGLNTNEFNGCFDSRKYLGAIQEDLEEGQNLGISGTPGFSINGTVVVGACPLSTFEEAFRAETERKKWSVVQCQFTLL